jgi:hypothetical protein
MRTFDDISGGKNIDVFVLKGMSPWLRSNHSLSKRKFAVTSNDMF